MLMNFGHGDVGLYAWPTAKSNPVAEYWMVFRLSAPIAFDAALITVPASCAAASDEVNARITTAAIRCFNMFASCYFFKSDLLPLAGNLNKNRGCAYGNRH